MIGFRLNLPVNHPWDSAEVPKESSAANRLTGGACKQAWKLLYSGIQSCEQRQRDPILHRSRRAGCCGACCVAVNLSRLGCCTEGVSICLGDRRCVLKCPFCFLREVFVPSDRQVFWTD